MRRGGGGPHFHQAFLAQLDQTGSSRALGAPSSPHHHFPSRAGSVWAPVVPMVTADHAAGDSRDAGGCAHLLVRAGEDRAVLTRTWARVETHPRGYGQRRSGYRWGRRTRPAAGARDPARERPAGARAALGVAVPPSFSSPASPLQPRTGRASPAPTNLEDVGGQRAPPRPKNDLGREVTCAPGPRCGCSQRSQGGGETGRLLGGADVSDLCSAKLPAWWLESRGPRLCSAAPSPPPTCDCSPPPSGRCPRVPAAPQPAELGAPSPRALPGAPPPAPGVPAHPHVRHPPPRRARRRGPSPGRRPWRLEDRRSRGRATESGSRRRGARLANTAAPPHPAPESAAGTPPGLAGASGLRVGGTACKTLRPGRDRDGNTGNPTLGGFPKY